MDVSVSTSIITVVQTSTMFVPTNYLTATTQWIILTFPVVTTKALPATATLYSRFALTSIITTQIPVPTSPSERTGLAAYILVSVYLPACFLAVVDGVLSFEAHFKAQWVYGLALNTIR